MLSVVMRSVVMLNVVALLLKPSKSTNAVLSFFVNTPAIQNSAKTLNITTIRITCRKGSPFLEL
jgi:hypothetical protein